MKFHHKAKALGLEYYETNMGMFNYQVKLVIGSEAKAVELVNWFHDDPKTAYFVDGPEPNGQVFWKPNYAPIIWLPRKPENASDYATFAHECCHVLVRMFDWAGMPVDMSTDEVLAHGVGFLIKDFSRRFK